MRKYNHASRARSKCHPERRKQAASLESRERLRRQYRPRRVRILFVGEAPPASGRFFYHADSGLYRAIRDTFMAAFPSLRSSNGKFLEAFRGMGCYLVDLCGKPVDRMDRSSRRCVCEAGEKRLARKLRTLRPMIVITVIRSIGSNIRRAEAAAGWSGLHLELPYPGRWHHFRVSFRRQLMSLLRTALPNKDQLQSCGRNAPKVAD
jgi:hypothetical protein